jgi:membrane protease YdiL (CAAX protease family)
MDSKIPFIFTKLPKKSMPEMQKQARDIARFSAVLIYLILLFLLEIKSGDSEVPGNLDSPAFVHTMQLFQFVAALITFIFPALLIVWFLAPERLSYLGLANFPRPVYFFLAFALILCASPLISELSTWNQHMSLPGWLSGLETWMKNSEDKAGELTTAMLKMDTLVSLGINLIVIAFMAALSEELFFRGLLQNVLKEVFRNYHVAVWTAAIIFSAFHMQFYGFLPRMILGAGLGYLYVWSGSIWVSVLAHFTNNAFGVIAEYLQQHGKVAPKLDAVGSSKEDLIYVLCSILFCSLLLIAAYRFRLRPTNKKEDQAKISTGEIS